MILSRRAEWGGVSGFSSLRIDGLGPVLEDPPP